MDLNGILNHREPWTYSTPVQFDEWNDVFGDFMLDDPWSFLHNENGIAMLDSRMEL